MIEITQFGLFYNILVHRYQRVVMGGVAWTEEEDHLLRDCIQRYGEGKWHRIPLLAGLNRCRKSCRLRWFNYLRPNIKRGSFTNEEVEHIIKLHKLNGNRWSLIASRLPGRTANDVKNYWNCHLSKRLNNAHINESNQRNEKIQNDHDDDHVVLIEPRCSQASKGGILPKEITPYDQTVPKQEDHTYSCAEEEGIMPKDMGFELEEIKITSRGFDELAFDMELWTDSL